MLNFCFLTPKIHILARNHIVNIFCVKIGSGPWLWLIGRNQKKEAE